MDVADEEEELPVVITNDELRYWRTQRKLQQMEEMMETLTNTMATFTKTVGEKTWQVYDLLIRSREDLQTLKQERESMKCTICHERIADVLWYSGEDDICHHTTCGLCVQNMTLANPGELLCPFCRQKPFKLIKLRWFTSSS